MAPGFDTERFIDQEQIEGYTCCICLKVFEDPLDAPCGHTFCAICVTDAIKIKAQCPYCRQALTNGQLKQPVVVLRNLLNVLKLKCEFASKGCTDVFALGDIKNHEKVCKFYPTKCTLEGCDVFLPRGELAQHQENCLFKLVPCPFECNAAVRVNSVEAHKQECLNAPIMCTQNCEKMIQKKDLNNHIANECMNTLFNCPFEGCEDKVKRIDAQAHINEQGTKHLMGAMQVIKNMQNMIIQQGQQIQLHQQEIINLKKQVAEGGKNDKLEGMYLIMNSGVQYIGLDLDYGATANGTKITAYKVHGGANQVWIIKRATLFPTGYYVINFTSNTAVTLENKVNGAKVFGSALGAFNQSQVWNFENVKDDIYYIENFRNKMVLDLKDGNHANFATIQGFTKTLNNPNQIWKLQKIN